MRSLLRHVSVVFAAGALGGLANGLVVWAFGQWGIPQALGVKIAPDWSWPWLYPRVVWGGLWGLLFLLPVLRNRHLLAGLLYSLGPSAGMLLVVFPYQLDKGILGLDVGAATPAFVLLYNAVWGLVAGAWLLAVRRHAAGTRGNTKRTEP